LRDWGIGIRRIVVKVHQAISALEIPAGNRWTLAWLGSIPNSMSTSFGLLKWDCLLIRFNCVNDLEYHVCLELVHRHGGAPKHRRPRNVCGPAMYAAPNVWRPQKRMRPPSSLIGQNQTLIATPPYIYRNTHFVIPTCPIVNLHFCRSHRQTGGGFA